MPVARRPLRRAMLVAALLWPIAACNSAVDRPSIPSTGSVTATPTTTTALSITPVTPDGFATGPGVTDGAITLGLLVDPDRDRGFTDGIELWQQSVNTSGGLCGRSVQLMSAGQSGVPADVVGAYDAIGRETVGLITLPPLTASVALNSAITSDQIPTLTPSGTSTQLGPGRPIVIGPTEDILAINGLDYLLQAGRIEPGATVGVLTDGSAASDNALSGARWWAGQQDVTLDVRRSEPDTAPAQWGPATTVLSLTDTAGTARLAQALPPNVTILTTIDGYDPADWPAEASAVATAGRVLVSTAAPAFGSDYPAAVAVASREAASEQVDPGPRLLDGYATGQNWGRLLTQACADLAVTRQAIWAATAAVGPASVDSLFGPTDPALPVQSGLPATRVSAMSTADPGAPAGLQPLTWPQAASGIEDYVP